MSKLAARVLRKNEKKKFSSKNKVKLGSSDEFCYKIVLNKVSNKKNIICYSFTSSAACGQYDDYEFVLFFVILMSSATT